MNAHNVEELIGAHERTEPTYREFIRSKALSLGLATWPAGSSDDQVPHREDEVYHCLAGRARLRVGEDDRLVGPGDVIYVAAGIEHRFHSIEEDLEVLVFWAPPYSGR